MYEAARPRVPTARRRRRAPTPGPPTTVSSTPRSWTRDRPRSTSELDGPAEERPPSRASRPIRDEREPVGDHATSARSTGTAPTGAAPAGPSRAGGRARPGADGRGGAARRAHRRSAARCRPSTPTTASVPSATGWRPARSRSAGCWSTCCRCSTTSTAPRSTAISPVASRRSPTSSTTIFAKLGLVSFGAGRRPVRPGASTRPCCTTRADDVDRADLHDGDAPGLQAQRPAAAAGHGRRLRSRAGAGSRLTARRSTAPRPSDAEARRRRRSTATTTKHVEEVTPA